MQLDLTNIKTCPFCGVTPTKSIDKESIFIPHMIYCYLMDKASFIKDQAELDRWNHQPNLK